MSLKCGAEAKGSRQRGADEHTRRWVNGMTSGVVCAEARDVFPRRLLISSPGALGHGQTGNPVAQATITSCRPDGATQHAAAATRGPSRQCVRACEASPRDSAPPNRFLRCASHAPVSASNRPPTFSRAALLPSAADSPALPPQESTVLGTRSAPEMASVSTWHRQAMTRPRAHGTKPPSHG